MNRRFCLILFGPPGSGKGTQAAILREKLSLAHISTGDILRDRIASADPLGLEVAATMNRGDLVPDAVVNRIVEDRIEKPDARRGFILDGYPRTVAQAGLLAAMLRAKQIATFVIHLKVDYNEVIARLSGRRQCPACGAIEHFVSNDQGVKLCANCGTKMVIRNDDRPEVVGERLKAYDEKTAPVLEFLRGAGFRVTGILGQGRTPEAIAAEIETRIDGEFGLAGEAAK
jgi:adenylate kinase